MIFSFAQSSMAFNLIVLLEIAIFNFDSLQLTYKCLTLIRLSRSWFYSITLPIFFFPTTPSSLAVIIFVIVVYVDCIVE